ncbi:MAG: abortive infection system antitoxin AbiGi family protein [Fluviicola sp.]|jgi:hypothetical protein
MGLSSNSLIHFTKDINLLKGILKDNFRLKYCFENVYTEKNIYRGGIPMVSFCDIPLSEIKEHISKYGCYGIGLTKEWGIKNKLNPVLYLEENSYLAQNFLEKIFETVLTDKGFDKTDENKIALADIFRYIKNYQADLERNGEKIENYRFSDEREWRYCPPLNIMHDNPFMISKSKEKVLDKIDDYNKNISKLKLNFSPNDITYIIIKSESEISEIIRFLEDSKGNSYSYNEVKRLTTRIITTDQIMSDF